MVASTRPNQRPTAFQPNVDVSRNLPIVEATGEPARALRSIAGDFRELATQVGSWADNAAAQEGRRAGEVEGLGEGYTPKRDNTIFGNAYDAAGNRALLLQTETRARNDLMQASLQHGEDPAAMAAASRAIREKYVGAVAGVVPELRGDLDATIQRLGDSYTFQAGKENKAKQEQGDKETFVISVADQRADAARMARASAGDPNLGQRLNQARERMVEQVAARTDLTPRQRKALIDDYDMQTVGAVLEGQIERITDPAALKRFQENAEREWQAKTGAIGRLDDKMWDGLKGIIEKRAQQLQRGQDQAQRQMAGTVAELEQRVLKGEAIPARQMAEATARLTAADPTGQTTQQLAALQELQDWGQRFRVLSVGDQRATLNAFDTRAVRAGLSDAEESRRKLARNVLAERERDDTNDPLGTAPKNFGIQIAPIRWGEDGALPDLRRRMIDAEAIATQTNRPVTYLTRADRDALKNEIERDPANAIRLGNQILQGAGDRAPRVLRELSTELPGLAYALRPGNSKVADEWLKSEQASRAGVKGPAVQSDQLRERFVDLGLSQLFEGRPIEMGQMIDAARPIVAQRLGPNVSKLDPNDKQHRAIVDDVLKDMVGRQRDVRGSRDIGGPVKVNGFTTMAPSAMASDMFSSVLNIMTKADLDAAGIKPVDAAGRAIAVGDLQGARWHPVAKDRYRVSLTGKLDAVNPWVGGADGKPLEIDLSPASPLLNRLRERAPRLFR